VRALGRRVGGNRAANRLAKPFVALQYRADDGSFRGIATDRAELASLTHAAAMHPSIHQS
jgi:hypothetical protein